LALDLGQFDSLTTSKGGSKEPQEPNYSQRGHQLVNFATNRPLPTGRIAF